MPSFLTRDTRVFVSKNTENQPATPATGYNASIAGLTANYLRCLMTDRRFMTPQLGTRNDLDKLGHGNEFLTATRADYWQQPTMTIGDDANATNMVLFLIRAFSGTVTSGLPAFMPDGTTATPTGGAIQHDVSIQSQAQGRQLLSFNTIVQAAYQDDTNVGWDFRFTGCVVDNFTVSQQQGQPPQWSAELVGSGRYITPSGLVTASGTSQVPDLIDQRYIHSASIGFSYVADSTTVDLAASGRVVAFSLGFQNNARRADQRIGDPFMTAYDPNSGAYTNRIERGRRSCNFTVTITADSNLAEFLLHRNQTLVQDITISMYGNLITGTGAYAAQASNIRRHNDMVRIIIPRAKISAIELGDDNDVATLQLTFDMIKPSTAIEYIKAQIINQQNTYYPSYS